MHSIVHFRIFEKKSREIVFLENIGPNAVTAVEWVFQARIHHNMSMDATDFDGCIQASLQEVLPVRKNGLAGHANAGSVCNIIKNHKVICIVKNQRVPASWMF